MVLFLAMGISPAWADEEKDAAERAAFQIADERSWRQVFADEGTGDWKRKWFLDGEVGKVSNGPEGMTLTAGPEFKNHAHHMVLWTRESFEGDLKIEYDHTRQESDVLHPRPPLHAAPHRTQGHGDDARLPL